MVRRTLLLGILLAGSAAFAADDDIGFARALAQKGFYDLALEVCTQVETSPKAPADSKSSIPFIKAEISITQGEQEPDPKAALVILDEALKQLDAFLATHKDHPLANDARVLQGQAKMRKAQILNSLMSSENDATAKSGYQSQIVGLYGDIENEYRRRIRDLQAKVETEDNEVNQNALMDALLELPRTLLDHARYGGVSDDDKKKLLGEVITSLDEFQFNYGDRATAYEGMRIQGEAYYEQGDPAKAESCLRGTMELLDRLTESKVTPNEYHWGIIRSGYIALAKMFTKMGDGRKAVEGIDEYLAKDKSIKGTEPYYYMLTLKADARFQANERDKAVAILNAIKDEAGADSKWGNIAKDKIQGYLSAPAAAGSKIAAKDLFTSGESCSERGKFFEAIQALRQCIEASQSKEDQDKYLVNAWFKIGQCFQALKRNYEAAFAYERVVDLVGKGENALGPKACFLVVRCYSSEFDAWGAKADADMKDKFMTRLTNTWPTAKEGKNFPTIQAEQKANAGDLAGAAELYLKTDDQAEAYEFALVQAGVCFYTDAARKWSKSKRESGDKSSCATEMGKAEEPLKKFLARLADPAVPAPEDPNEKDLRDKLKFGAQQQLALLYSHETVGKAAECLTLVDEIAKELLPGDERLAKLWQLKVGAFLAVDKVEDAVNVLEEMFKNFPDGAPIAIASKSVAIRLDEATVKLMKDNGDEKTVTANLKKVAKYYRKWLDEGPSVGLRITLADVVSVAEILYMVAKRVNGMDDKVTSFLDLKDQVIKEKSYWNDAAFVHEMLLGGKAGKISDKDRLDLMTRLARCYSFLAETPQHWDKAKGSYLEIVKAYKLVDDKQNVDVSVLQAKPALLSIYLELGAVYLELGKSGQKFQFDNSITVYNNVLKCTAGGSEPWWMAKYMALYALFARGATNDVETCKIAVGNLQSNYPDFDGDKYGMKTKFKDLARRIGLTLK